MREAVGESRDREAGSRLRVRVGGPAGCLRDVYGRQQRRGGRRQRRIGARPRLDRQLRDAAAARNRKRGGQRDKRMSDIHDSGAATLGRE